MAYWLLTAALIAFGIVTGFSIGQPILLVGLVMLVVGPWRRRPEVFWPPFLGVVAFDVAYLAIAPWTCTTTAVLGGTSSTVCTSLIGLRYGGEGVVNPSLLPAAAVGLVVGVSVALLSYVVLARWKRGRRPPPAG
jgi:hypothetical protein